MKTIIFTILTIILSCVMTFSIMTYANHVEADLEQDYGGELPDGKLITVRFLYNGCLMYEAVATEEELDYTVSTISEQMIGQLVYHESTEDLIIYYYGSGETYD